MHSSASRIFSYLLSVSSGDETLRLMLDILHACTWKTRDVYIQDNGRLLKQGSYSIFLTYSHFGKSYIGTSWKIFILIGFSMNDLIKQFAVFFSQV